MSDATIHRVLHDLKVISAVQENHRIYRNDNGLLNIDSGGWTSSLYRFMMRENRYRNIQDITNVINDAFVIAEHACKSIESRETSNNREAKILIAKNLSLISSIKEYVEATEFGLHNIKATYADDKSLNARVEVLNELKNQSLSDLQTSINSIKEKLDL
tara:strand:+ start:181 stop:657 length:477 start_codon:yes stop_codon:yes gene_type:complete